MEPAWSLSIGAPVDPSEPRSSPGMRRHSADLLFRGYSSPVDKKTIENVVGETKAGLGQFGMDDMHELRQRDKTDRQRCPSLLIAPGNFLFL